MPREVIMSCVEPDCPENFSSKSKWDNIKKADEGWFIGRDGNIWCPNHLPEWVGPWREMRDISKIKEQLIGEIQEAIGRDETYFSYLIGPDGWFCIKHDEDGKKIGTYKIDVFLRKVD